MSAPRKIASPHPAVQLGSRHQDLVARRRALTMTARADTALVALRRILRAAEMDAKELARRTGLTASQIIVLQIVGRTGEAMGGRIAEQASISQATVTALVDKLEARGLVVRRRGETDRRQVWVTITQEGRAALADSPDFLQRRFEERFNTLQDWEQSFLVAALERVAALMGAEGLDAAPLLALGAIDRAPAEDEGEERRAP